MRETPLSYYELVDHLGAEIANELIKHFGGTTLFIPARMHTEHPIAVALSLPMAKRVSNAYKGEPLYIPNMKSVRNRSQIIALREQGLTVQHIALAVDLTEVRIYQILAEDKKDPRQLDIF